MRRKEIKVGLASLLAALLCAGVTSAQAPEGGENAERPRTERPRQVDRGDKAQAPKDD